MQKPNNPAITSGEAGSLVTAMGDLDPAHFEYRGRRYEASVKSCLGKLQALPHGAVLVPLTTQEMRVLWGAITNGAEGVLQPTSGYNAEQRRAFSRAANRIADAGKITAPRFDEMTQTDKGR